MMSACKAPLNVRVSHGLRAQLKREAKKRKAKPSPFIRALLVKALEDQAFMSAALAAYVEREGIRG